MANRFCCLEKILATVFNIHFSIHFGLVWNEMQSSLPIKADARKNHDDGVPAHKAKLAQDWIAIPTAVNKLVKISGLLTRRTSIFWIIVSEEIY